MRIITKNTSVSTSTRYDNEGNIVSQKTTTQDSYSIEVLPHEVLDEFIRVFSNPESKKPFGQGTWCILEGQVSYKNICPELKLKNYSMFYRQPKELKPDADGIIRGRLPANRKSWEGITEYKGVKVEIRDDIYTYDLQGYGPGPIAEADIYIKSVADRDSKSMVFIFEGEEYYAIFLDTAVIFVKPFSAFPMEEQPEWYRNAAANNRYMREDEKGKIRYEH